MKKRQAPREGDMRVWNVTVLGCDADHYPVMDAEHACRLINALAESQLLDPRITDNAFGLEIYESGEWCEWYSEAGEDIGEWSDNREDVK